MSKENHVPGKWRQVLATIIINLSALAIGLSCGWGSIVAQAFLKDDNEWGIKALNYDEVSWLLSVALIGTLLSMLLGPTLCEVFGRKPAAIIMATILFISVLMKILATNFTILIIAQLLHGISDGLSSLIVSIYVTEIASDSMRGRLGSLWNFSVMGGYLISFIFVTMMSHKIFTGIILIAPVVLFIGMFFMPESPVYLIRRQRIDAAKRSLMWFRGNDQSIAELEATKLEQFHKKITQAKSSLGFTDIFTDPVNRKGFGIAMIMVLMQQLSGISIMMVYVVLILDAAKTVVDARVAPMAFAISLLIGCWLSVFSVDRFGRRPLLFFSTIGIFTSYLILSVFFTLQHMEVNVTKCDWLPIIAIFILGFSYTSGIGPLAPMVANEVYNPELASKCNSIYFIIFSLVAFLLSKTFPAMAEAMGFHNCFFIFLGFCIISFFTVLFIIPETKGKSIETIRNELEGTNQADNKTDIEQLESPKLSG